MSDYVAQAKNYADQASRSVYPTSRNQTQFAPDYATLAVAYGILALVESLQPPPLNVTVSVGDTAVVDAVKAAVEDHASYRLRGNL